MKREIITTFEGLREALREAGLSNILKRIEDAPELSYIPDGRNKLAGFDVIKNVDENAGVNYSYIRCYFLNIEDGQEYSCSLSRLFAMRPILIDNKFAPVKVKTGAFAGQFIPASQPVTLVINQKNFFDLVGKVFLIKPEEIVVPVNFSYIKKEDLLTAEKTVKTVYKIEGVE